MLRQFESLLQASPKIIALQVIDHDAIDAENFLGKIRCQLVSGPTLHLRLRAVASVIRYSYRTSLTRLPHFPHLPEYPHHYHSQQSYVTQSLR
jgi:hypothetical protein